MMYISGQLQHLGTYVSTQNVHATVQQASNTAAASAKQHQQHLMQCCRIMMNKTAEHSNPVSTLLVTSVLGT
jgi:hypothetical protein